jgi:hypothetical protein
VDAPFLSGETIAAAARLERILNIANGGAPQSAPPTRPPIHGEPYAIEQYAGVNGSVNLIGRDGRGEIMFEFRVSARRVNRRMLAQMVNWCKSHDDGPRLLP